MSIRQLGKIKRSSVTPRAFERLDVVAGIAHDLRTPLATLTTSADLLEQEMDSDMSNHLISIIQRQVQRLQVMIQDISEYASFESGKVLIHPGAVDLVALVKEACTDLQEFEAAHKVVFLVPATPVRVVGDYDKLRRILENLLRNAFKYSPEGSTVKVSLDLRTDGYAVIIVEDDGLGIPVDRRDDVFQPFVQLSNARQGGQGLGLHIVKLLAEAHQGFVSVDDSPNGGARFSVSLPLPARP